MTPASGWSDGDAGGEERIGNMGMAPFGFKRRWSPFSSAPVCPSVRLHHRSSCTSSNTHLQRPKTLYRQSPYQFTPSTPSGPSPAQRHPLGLIISSIPLLRDPLSSVQPHHPQKRDILPQWASIVSLPAPTWSPAMHPVPPLRPRAARSLVSSSPKST